ncbi:MAG: Nicotinate phosphoribosyltransferase pncB2 [Chlamydiia bacterium]|nr:Nicotinate phosphoribosyltransferase pncB2 [Chlamydiia bacterium]
MDQSYALFTDFYQLTMAYGYWKRGLSQQRACFVHFFRKKPFGGEVAVCAGLETLVQFIESFRFSDDDIAYLKTIQGVNKKPFFEPAFLDYLREFRFDLDLFAVPEGTPVSAYQPMIRVEGPIIAAQLIESPLLNIINFQTLIATKGSRVSWVAGESEVIEFGLRRAQGYDGALSATRASFIGGCQSTSNVMAGKRFDIPVRGTHAHSWIMTHDTEEEAFVAYNSLSHGSGYFLIDTYDSIGAVKNLIRLAQEDPQFKLKGVRLDSGDLAVLSIEIRRLLDEAGFKDAQIMASNELDEYLIRDIKQQKAPIDVFGVGTQLVTGGDQSALDGVYKMSAFMRNEGEWALKIKLSEQIEKMTTPGRLQTRRYMKGGVNLFDLIYDEDLGVDESLEMIDQFDITSTRKIPKGAEFIDLLVPILQDGKRVYELPSLKSIQGRGIEMMGHYPENTRRLYNPNKYWTYHEKRLLERKLALIKEMKQNVEKGSNHR